MWGKTNLHQDKILLPLTCLPFSPPIFLPLLIHPRPIPIPLPFRSHPTHLLPPSHSPSVRSPLSFRPHPTPRPSAAHSPLSVTPRTCSSVTLSPLATNLLTRLPVNSSTCPLLPELVHLLPCLLSHTTCSLVSPSTRQLARYSPNLFICYPVSSRIQLVNSSPHQLVNLPVTHRTCSSVTLSPLAYNLLTRQLTMLLPELVHMLPCLLIQLTCPLVHSFTRLLVNYFYHLTFLSVLVQNTATLILPFLSPLFNIEMITISKTSY